jgi:transposase InsO family protein
MTTVRQVSERKRAIYAMLRGKTLAETAEAMNRSTGWVHNWWHRYQKEGWQGLHDRPRAPQHHGRKFSTATREAICQVRCELEAGAELNEGLKYIGARAVRTKLNERGLAQIPSQPTIERVLREARLTRKKEDKPKVKYPRLRPMAPHILYQVDIVPHYLRGGQRVSGFNAIDVVSRYPMGLPFSQRRSQDAAEFLLHLWREMGIPTYTQVDNEGCFSGGATHRYVLGKVVRLALAVGTELLFSPVGHPQSNGTVERFHQEYTRHVWQDTYLAELEDVAARTTSFLAHYRQRQDHSALDGQTPQALHTQLTPGQLPADFTLTESKRPLMEGKVHFMRQLSPEGQVRVLNVDWAVPEPNPLQGVWVTIDFQVTGATLYIFDATPDVAERRCLASYPFSLCEPVYPRPQPQPQPADMAAETDTLCESTHSPDDSGCPAATPRLLPERQLTRRRITAASILSTAICRTAHLTSRVFFTMY